MAEILVFDFLFPSFPRLLRFHDQRSSLESVPSVAKRVLGRIFCSCVYA
jgi:hypothetical protein